MESKLYEASLRGDVTSLTELLKEDPLILERVITGYGNETPLHISVMCGHVEFAAKILMLKPEFASDMVRVLAEANSNVCLATDQYGRTPLHLASMKNHIQNLKLLIEIKPEAIQVLLNRGATIFHFCVKHGKSVSVNSVDDDGNTILHLAVARRQTKIIDHLLNTNVGVEINTWNKNGYTAVDILTTQCLRDFEDKEIEDLLRCAGGLSGAREQVPRAEDGSQTIVITTEPSSNAGSNVTSEYDTPMRSHDEEEITASVTDCEISSDCVTDPENLPKV
ncbi:hypothetical protein MKW98_019010 [Papaver atlanticum]|uniref:Uncharacterized protein n=1 Tax=Papaver atlanticum TaxID=357466 RepID=A0AAD4TG40_9MAGN|nr:hypothetical protein MKW98_019010 [Papaver atlanticum]